MSYVNKKLLVFRNVGDGTTICVKRSEGRMKNYESAIDARSWSDDIEQKRQYILELIIKSKSCKRIIPLEDLIKFLMIEQNALIEKLKKQIDEYEKFINSLNLTPEQKAKMTKIKSSPVEAVGDEMEITSTAATISKKSILSADKKSDVEDVYIKVPSTKGTVSAASLSKISDDRASTSKKGSIAKSAADLSAKDTIGADSTAKDTISIAKSSGSTAKDRTSISKSAGAGSTTVKDRTSIAKSAGAVSTTKDTTSIAKSGGAGSTAKETITSIAKSSDVIGGGPDGIASIAKDTTSIAKSGSAGAGAGAGSTVKDTSSIAKSGVSVPKISRGGSEIKSLSGEIDVQAGEGDDDEHQTEIINEEQKKSPTLSGIGAGGDVDKVMKENEELNKQFEDCKAELNRLKNRLGDADLIKLSEENCVLKCRLKEKERECYTLSIKADEVKYLKNEINCLQCHINDLKQIREKYEALIKKTKDYDELKNAYCEMIAREKERCKECCILREQAEKIPDLECERNCLIDEIKNCQCIIQSKDDEIVRLINHVDIIDKDKQEQEKKLKQESDCLQEELEEKKCVLAEDNDIKKNLQNTIEYVTCECTCLKQYISKLEKEILCMQEKLNESEDEKANMKKNIEKLQSLVKGDQHSRKLIKLTRCAVEQVSQALQRHKIIDLNDLSKPNDLIKAITEENKLLKKLSTELQEAAQIKVAELEKRLSS